MKNDYSVLMAVYAGETAEYLEQSIESMLQQTLPSNDFVLVCDGLLTEELDKIVEKYAILSDFNIVRLPENKGLAEALNIGLAFCKNNIVARMDSDDIAAANRCELQLLHMDYCDIIGGVVEEFILQPGDLGRFRKTAESHEDIVRFAKRRNPFNHPALMYKKNAVENAGGYTSEFPLAEDYCLWVKMIMDGCHTKNLGDTILNMRIGNGLYHRRSGMKYFKMIISFRRWLKHIGFISQWDFLICFLTHFVTCLSPNPVRAFIYGKILRIQHNRVF